MVDEDLGSHLQLESLTQRERDILRLLAEGQTNREIAQALSLELTTVKWYNKQIFDKLGVSTRQKAVLQAQKFGLLEHQARTDSDRTSPAYNLPVQLTSFVGREREVAEVLHLLEDARLLTLTGPPGTGKTRLALNVASKIAASHAFGDGVCYVDLAPISKPDHVADQIAGALGIQDSSGKPVKERLCSYLGNKHLLLLVDNYEHVIAEAPLMGELLSCAPRLKILVTSRESLQVYGEHQYPVPPLELPMPDRPISSSIAQIESVALFIQRARAIRHDFSLTEENAPSVAEICIRLDGIPLAIELAAARVKVFSPQVLVDQLASRFTLLEDGLQGLPEHQQTLYRAIEWSYDLLDEAEKTLFARLSVFQGGRTIDAVQEVCSHDLTLNALSGLESLVNKSLMYTVEDPGGEPRFLFLESIHDYARAMLEQREETSELRHRHAAYFASLAERVEPHLNDGPEQLYWLLRLEDDHDNLLAALEWSLGGADIGLGLRLAGALPNFWNRHAYIAEGRRWTQRALEAAGNTDPSLRASLLSKAGKMAFEAGDLQSGKPMHEEALALYRALGDQDNIGATLIDLGLYSLGQPQEYEAAIDLVVEGLALLREVEDRSGIASALTGLGELARMQGDFDKARKAYLEALDVARDVGATFRQWVLYNNLGLMALEQGDAEEAETWVRQFLGPASRLGYPFAIVSGLHVMAGVVSQMGIPERAARLIGAAQSLHGASRRELPNIDIVDYGRIEAIVRSQLSSEDFEAAYAQGQSMSLEEAAAYALADPDAG